MNDSFETHARRPARALALGGLAVAVALAAAPPARALEARAGREVVVGPDEVIEDDLYLFGETVVIAGRVTGDVMVSGRKVVVRGEVEGDLTGCAHTFVIEGAVGDDTRVAGMLLRLESASRVGDDVMAAGLSFESKAGSSIGGSVGFAGRQARVAGDVREDLSVAATGVALLGIVGGNVEVEVESEASPWPFAQWLLAPEPLPEVPPGLTLAAGARVGGDLAYTSMAVGQIAADARIDGSITRKEPAVQPQEPLAGSGRLAGALRWWVAMLIAGGLVLWRFSGMIDRVSAELRSRPFESLGWGVVVTLGWTLAVIAALAVTVSLLVATGWLVLPRLSWLVLAIGGTLEALLVGGWAMLVLLSPLAVAVVVGGALLGRARLLRSRSLLWPGVTGLIVLGAIRLLPYGSLVVASGSLLVGSGALWLAAVMPKPRASPRHL